MLRTIFLDCLILGGCSLGCTSNDECPQPSQPTCVVRATAWCSSATFRGSADVLGDAGVLVPCPDSSGNRLFAVFDGGMLDDAGLPKGCPSLSTIPSDLSKSVLDAGTRTAALAAIPREYIAREHQRANPVYRSRCRDLPVAPDRLRHKSGLRIVLGSGMRRGWGTVR